MNGGQIDCACIAKVVTDTVELRTSAKGTLWARFTAVVGNSPDNETWLSVSIFGDVAQNLAGTIARGDKLYLEGTLRLNECTSREGEKRTGVQISAWKAQKVGAAVIGRNRPRRSPRNGPRSAESNQVTAHSCLEA